MERIYCIKSLNNLFEILVNLKILNKTNRNWLNIEVTSFYNNDYYFRGQSSKYSKITSSLSRNQSYINNEEKIFSETLLNRKKDFHNYKTPIEIMAKMQHYGFPTRLIDFTFNPLIALFFAIEDDISNDNSDLYICKDEYEKENNNNMYQNLISNMALFGLDDLVIYQI